MFSNVADILLGAHTSCMVASQNFAQEKLKRLDLILLNGRSSLTKKVRLNVPVLQQRTSLSAGLRVGQTYSEAQLCACFEQEGETHG